MANSTLDIGNANEFEEDDLSDGPGPEYNEVDPIELPRRKLTNDERSQKRLERLMSNLERGWKITVYRVQPAWCRGHLQTIEIYDPAEDVQMVDPDYLAQQWGGHKLHLRILDERGRWMSGGNISLFSYPPKVNGRVLDDPSAHRDGQYLPVPTQNSPGTSMDITKLFEMIAKNKSSGGTDAATMIKLFELIQAQNRQSQPPPPAVDMANQMAAMLGVMERMQSVMSGFGSAAARESDPDNMLPMLADMFKQLMVQKTNRRPVYISGPSGRQNQPEHPPILGASPVKSGNSNDSSDDTLDDLASKLARLSANDAADVVTMALGSMPDSKRPEAMQRFLENMSDDDINIDNDNNSSNNIVDE